MCASDHPGHERPRREAGLLLRPGPVGQAVRVRGEAGQHHRDHVQVPSGAGGNGIHPPHGNPDRVSSLRRPVRENGANTRGKEARAADLRTCVRACGRRVGAESCIPHALCSLMLETLFACNPCVFYYVALGCYRMCACMEVCIFVSDSVSGGVSTREHGLHRKPTFGTDYYCACFQPQHTCCVSFRLCQCVA